MVKIVIENLGQKEIILNETSKPVLRLMQEAGVDWMTDCGGKGRCTTCKAVVVSGAENLTPNSPAELKYRAQGLLHSNERLMCQARLREALPRSEARAKGDLILKVPKESQLRHLKYSE